MEPGTKLEPPIIPTGIAVRNLDVYLVGQIRNSVDTSVCHMVSTDVIATASRLPGMAEMAATRNGHSDHSRIKLTAANIASH